MIKLGAQFLAAGHHRVVRRAADLLAADRRHDGRSRAGSSFTLTVFSIVIVMNAVNFIDGLDGLVAGVCLIANAVFFAYSYMLVRDFGSSTYFTLASFIAAVLIGACIGFLPLNWSPARSCSWAMPARSCWGCSWRARRSRSPGSSTPRCSTDNEDVRPLAAARCVHPDPAARRRRAAAAARLRPRRRAAHERGQVAVLARPQAPASPHARHGPHRPRRRADLLRVDGDREPRRAADVHRHDLGAGRGTTSSASLYGVVGVAACLVVTFLPSHRRAARDGAPIPNRSPILRPHGGRPMSPSPVSSTPILRTDLVWSGVVTGDPRGRRRRRRLPRRRARRACGARSPACSSRRVFLAITGASILIANRWYGDDLYVPDLLRRSCSAAGS